VKLAHNYDFFFSIVLLNSVNRAIIGDAKGQKFILNWHLFLEYVIILYILKLCPLNSHQSLVLKFSLVKIW
jgi:hypothetical protein